MARSASGVTRPFHKNGRGRGRKVPRLASGSRPARRVEELLEEPPSEIRPGNAGGSRTGRRGQ